MANEWCKLSTQVVRGAARLHVLANENPLLLPNSGKYRYR